MSLSVFMAVLQKIELKASTLRQVLLRTLQCARTSLVSFTEIPPHAPYRLDGLVWKSVLLELLVQATDKDIDYLRLTILVGGVYLLDDAITRERTAS